MTDNMDDNKIFHLVMEAQQGSSSAVEGLYRIYEERLIVEARKRLGRHLRNHLETQDILQSVWKDTLSELNGFEYKDQRKFFNWLLLRIVRKIQDKGRFYSTGKRSWNPEKAQPIQAADASALRLDFGNGAKPAGSPGESAMTHENVEHVLDLMSSLSEDHRKVLLFRLKDNKDYADIATVMDRSEKATRQLYHRALLKLKSLWRERFPFAPE